MAKWDLSKISNSDDLIKDPKHYTRWAIEPIVFIMANSFAFWRGNVVKYVSRAGSKAYDGQTMEQSEVTDLRKAIRYCEIRIEEIERKAL
jgi:hypothetical protein|tara:strand:+ start:1836 stop:2105 length:270 start_codon:yes stop_codon:yes gene_type:complete